MLFQTTFEPKLVAEASKELVFVLSQRKIRCVAISFFGVGGSGRRPLESADPGGGRVGLYNKRVSNRWSLVGNCGRGRGARGCAKEIQEMVVLCRKSKGSALWGRLRGRTCPRSGQRELQGGLLDTCWELRGVFLKPFWVKNSVLGVPVGSGVRFRS